MGNSLEEDVVTLDASTAGPISASSRTGCSRGNPVVYDWKEINHPFKSKISLEFIKALSVYTRIYMSLYVDPAYFYDAVMMFLYTL